MASFDLISDRLTVSGALDAEAEEQLKDRCRRLLDGGAGVVTIDLSQVKTITSVCIGVLVALWVDLRSAGRRAELTASPKVREMLDMSGLTSVLMSEGNAKG